MQLTALLDHTDSVATATRRTLPCHDSEHADLWFAESPSQVEQAKALCQSCPVKTECLRGALRRGEPWGVWGGELFADGLVVPRKRPRGRPRKHPFAEPQRLATEPQHPAAELRHPTAEAECRAGAA